MFFEQKKHILKAKGLESWTSCMEKKNSIRKLNIEMVLVSMDLWNIVNGSKNAPPSNMDVRVLKEDQRHIKMAISIIVLNLVDNQHAQGGVKDPM